MAKGKGDEEAAEEGPFDPIKKQLKRYRLLAGFGILVSLVLFAGSVTVVVYSGIKSMSAFEDLPKYQINTLALAYRDSVKRLDESMAATSLNVDGEPGQRVLQKSRTLVEQMLASEQAHELLLQTYAESMAIAAEQVGGALEWNRYFQADIKALRDHSAERQSQLQVFFEQFPAHSLEQEDESETEETGPEPTKP